MNERTQADLLARWLASGARGEPPAGLDPDTVASVYALRPDLAPAPRLTADDILDGLTAGPFAAPEPDAEGGGGEVVPFPVPPSRPTVVPASTQDAAPPAPGAHRRWWIGGGAGLLAAAAAALLVLSPSNPSGPARSASKIADRNEHEDARPSAAQDAAPQAAAPAAAPIAEVTAGVPIPDASGGGGLIGDLPQGGLAGGAVSSLGSGAASRQLPAGSTAGPTASGYTATLAVPPPVATADDAVALAQDGDQAQTGAANPWAGAQSAANTAVDEKEEALTEPKVAARSAAPPPPTAFDAAADRAEAAAAPKQEAGGAPAFDANVVIAAASTVANSDPMAAARQLEPFIRQGSALDGQRIALAAARYARDAGDLDKAESLARAGLARGATAGPDASRLASLISAIAQTRAADQASPAAAPPGN